MQHVDQQAVPTRQSQSASQCSFRVKRPEKQQGRTALQALAEENSHKPATEDYVPVIPWFGVVLIGIFLGQRQSAGRGSLNMKCPDKLQRCAPLQQMAKKNTD